MPTFMADYRCKDCDEVSEILTHTRMKEDTTVEEDFVGCPNCGSLRMVQIQGGHSTKLHDKEALSACLKQRSADHSLKEIRKQGGWKTGALPKNFGKVKQS